MICTPNRVCSLQFGNDKGLQVFFNILKDGINEVIDST